MKCPDCIGGKIHHAIHPVYVTCWVCDGTGILPEDIQYDPERGRILKNERALLSIPLRAFCIANNIDAVTRSEEERGFFRKAVKP